VAWAGGPPPPRAFDASAYGPKENKMAREGAGGWPRQDPPRSQKRGANFWPAAVEL